MRPLICILCSEAFGGKYQDTSDAFIALELIHNGTLVHDDLIDDDQNRRGKKSVHALYGSKKAVLTGDILLSLSLKYACNTGKIKIIEKLSDAAMKMVQGVAMQTHLRGNIIPIPKYFELAYLKSGSLFETAAIIGGLLNDIKEEDLLNLSNFGKYFGLAYQIRDDILDITNNNEGKTRSDIANGDVSLPLIYALDSALIKEDDKELLISIFQGKKINYNEHEILRIYKDTESIILSINQMMYFAKESKKYLEAYSGPAIESLRDLIDQNYDKFNI